ncbi:hypothetical protein K1T71_008463 [Dendrolimus kikuchii]|uniref:Uncharacterized protein n=1 Tax=Dendrolimus kikuchii TaxID=765133 RepID=A0ACC1CXR7_9NEOP|nr:hypothetical protein K1T71_008463 [Dendrolimus kikuchii]
MGILRAGSARIFPIEAVVRYRAPDSVATIQARKLDIGDSMDLLRLMAQKPWRNIDQDYWHRTLRVDPDLDDDQARMEDQNEEAKYYSDEGIASQKRSAVATALNASRRRREPAPALGILSDVETFLDALRDNLNNLAALSPQQRSGIFQEPPTVVRAPSSGESHCGGSGGGSGFRKLHALRPLRPNGSIRSYNRRSFVEADGVYPGANHHDPGLLWTGLGR